jgi:hypothetical protein
MLQADPLGFVPTIGVLQVGHVHPVGHGVIEGDHDGAAFAGPLAGVEGLQDRLMGGHAGGNVADGDADPRRSLGRAVDAGEARFRLHQQVVGLLVAVGTLLPVARDRADDQTRVLLPQVLDGEAEACERARRQVLDEDVGLGQHALEQRLVPGLLQVETQRLLAPVEPDEIGAVAVHQPVIAAREVALGALDLHHARAGVGQAARGVGRGHGLFQGHHEKAFQVLHFNLQTAGRLFRIGYHALL